MKDFTFELEEDVREKLLLDEGLDFDTLSVTKSDVTATEPLDLYHYFSNNSQSESELNSCFKRLLMGNKFTPFIILDSQQSSSLFTAQSTLEIPSSIPSQALSINEFVRSIHEVVTKSTKTGDGRQVFLELTQIGHMSSALPFFQRPIAR